MTDTGRVGDAISALHLRARRRHFGPNPFSAKADGSMPAKGRACSLQREGFAPPNGAGRPSRQDSFPPVAGLGLDLLVGVSAGGGACGICDPGLRRACSNQPKADVSLRLASGGAIAVRVKNLFYDNLLWLAVAIARVRWRQRVSKILCFPRCRF